MVYISKTTPRAHQKKALELTRGKRLYAYLCEMGTGKSKMVLDEWAERVEAGTVHDLLIVAPAGSYRNWDRDKGPEQPSELRKHLSEAMFSQVSSCAWVSGAGKGAQRALAGFLALRKRPRVLVVNVEALSTAAGAVQACLTFLAVPGRRTMLVVDESTTIKNDKAKRTKVLSRMKDLADIRRILTGLVAPRSPLDLFSQFEFLDWRILGHKSIFTFKRRYCVMENIKVAGTDKEGKRVLRDVSVVVAYKNVGELQGKIAPYSYRVLKSDCLDLPPKIYMRRDVELTEEQKRVYNEMVLFSTAELKDKVHITATMVITKILRLHQIVCGHTVDEEGVTHDVKSKRIEALMEVLDEHQGKVIIWVNYRHEIPKIIEALEKEYGEGSTAQFHGGNKATRGKDEADYLSSPLCRFMVATQSAGGRGNTWVNANLVIYFSNNHDLELRMQSEDRCHRDGLKHSVTYIDLVCAGTIDEKILGALRKKLNMVTLITGENYREWLI